jgi:hypothetical protein
VVAKYPLQFFFISCCLNPLSNSISWEKVADLQAATVFLKENIPFL